MDYAWQKKSRKCQSEVADTKRAEKHQFISESVERANSLSVDNSRELFFIFSFRYSIYHFVSVWLRPRMPLQYLLFIFFSVSVTSKKVKRRSRALLTSERTFLQSLLGVNAAAKGEAGSELKRAR